MGLFSRLLVTRFLTTTFYGMAVSGGMTLSLNAEEFTSQKQVDKVEDRDVCGGDRKLEAPSFPLRTVSTVLQNELRELEQTFTVKFGSGKITKTCKQELQNLADAITNLYVKNGYINSQATLSQDSNSSQILIAEGEVNPLAVDSIQGLVKVDKDYVISRLQPYINSPFNANKLEEGLAILNRDPNFTKVRATIVAPEAQNTSTTTNTDANTRPSIKIDVEERKQFQVLPSFDNESPFALGTERYGVAASIANFTGFGDRFTFSYYGSTTGGLNQYDFSYSIPVNPQDGLLTFRIAPNNFRITQPEFDFLGIRGTNTLYELTFRQPIVRSRSDEFAVSLGYAYQSGQTFIFNDLNTPFGIGPDLDGSTRTGVLKFSQDYTVRDVTNSAWAFRSQFNLGTGLGAFNVSNNKADSPNAPTSNFFSWNGQIQRLQSLGRDVFLIASLDSQLANDPLLSSQQFVIGGAQSVRGFRQNLRVGDNGVRFSLENRWIVMRDEIDESPKLQFAPFIDLGGVWNNPRNPNQLPTQNFIAAGGLAAIFEPVKGLTMRVDYAIPFLQLPDKTNNLQDKSLYFKLNYKLEF
jgi:hemolysin activation/secretion protein